MDQTVTRTADVLTNALKQKRKQRAAKWDVPLPQVRSIPEDEMRTKSTLSDLHADGPWALNLDVCLV
jgi:hypothetical protein